MGLHTRSDIVKNVAYIGRHEKLYNLYCELAENCQEKETRELNGWTMPSNHYKNHVDSGWKGSLIATRLVKGDKHVFLLNTDQDESVGEYDYAVYSDDRLAVEEFLKDFSIDEKIEDTDSVCQTL